MVATAILYVFQDIAIGIHFRRPGLRKRIHLQLPLVRTQPARSPLTADDNLVWRAHKAAIATTAVLIFDLTQPVGHVLTLPV